MASISSIHDLSSEHKEALIGSVRAGEYNLFLGAGVSLDSHNSRNENLPTGTEFKHDLCKITGANIGSTLQRVFSGLTEDKIEEHVTKRFENCTPGETVKKIPSFLWRRIFTLNIDNALDQAYGIHGNLQDSRKFAGKQNISLQRYI
ncbi:hypothetical protein GXW78_13715 [Roseomonas terrae]|uniref:SIR2-like domain-containing protein n=1 Tax=Neoroseomonas terrae TaxID=424799 RepID=A0ABS5EI73_9PROT|nr:hypothetical protein [Neoroseomonas terrae]MBR0650729.1 hypothetical protein [Neoroseomonas terrae]